MSRGIDEYAARVGIHFYCGLLKPSEKESPEYVDRYPARDHEVEDRGSPLWDYHSPCLPVNNTPNEQPVEFGLSQNYRYKNRVNP